MKPESGAQNYQRENNAWCLKDGLWNQIDLHSNQLCDLSKLLNLSVAVFYLFLFFLSVKWA